MTRRLLMGLDAGGGGGRALLVDADSGKCWSAFRTWRHPSAPGTGGLGYDLDYADLRGRLRDAAREVVIRAAARPDEVAAIAATSMRFGMVVVDADGHPVYGGPNRDARAAGEGLTLAAQHGAALHALSGHWPAPILPCARLLWLKNRGGDAWARAHRYLALSDWATLELCGEIAAEPTQAAGSGLFDLRAGRWSEAWLERLGLPASLFPALGAAGARLGGLRPEAAEALGLRAGIPVSVGGGDTQCGLLGSGAVRAGAAGIVAGTSAPVQVVTAEPVIDPEGRLWSGAHVAAGRWVAESNAGPMGESIDWLAHLLFPDAPVPAARLLAEASRSEPGARGMLSTLGTQFFDARNLSLPVASLSFSHMVEAAPDGARHHLLRSVIEGSVFSLHANLEQVLSVSGGDPDTVHLGGGLTQSDFFTQLLADVSGRTLRRPPHSETTALGAAICAGVGAGVFRDVDQGAEALAPAHRLFEPDAERNARYAEVFARWTELHEKRAPADDLMRGHSMPAVLGAGNGPAPAKPQLRPTILVTSDLDQASLDALAEIGNVEYAPFREKLRVLNGDSLVRALDGVNVLVTEVDVIDASSMARLPELRAVATCRSDAVNVDVEAATMLGIPVLHAPGRNADAVADLTLGYLLMLSRKLTEANAFLRRPGGHAGDMGRMGQAFGALRGRELWRKTVGLVGLGAVGRGVAKRLAGFGARVLVFDPHLAPEDVVLAGAEPVSFEALLERSDFVSLHAPVTDATRGMLDANALARMKPGACLVNTARAALVDEAALLASLRDEHLAGAALDVFALEPPASDHPLLALDNVIATPHVGGNTQEVAAHQGAIIVAELERLVRGERPHHLLNPTSFDGFDWSQPRPIVDAAERERLARRPAPAVSDLQKHKRPTREPAGPPDATPAATGAVAEAMRKVLAHFVEGIAGGDALDRFAAGRDVTLHFIVSDLGDAFWFRLRDGEVRAAMGDPDAEPEVELRLAADVLDGMFTGRINPMQAAMEGRLAFSGDTAKAMSLQEFQEDLSYLYREARSTAGDPGDLTSLTVATSVAPDAADDDVRSEVVQVVGELYAQQMVTSTGGNVSVRIPDTDELWITPSQLFKGDLRPEALVRIDLQGRSQDAAARSASSEKLMHCAVYRVRPEAGAVIHAHAPNATILANAGLPFLPISTEAAFFADLPRIPFVMPGTGALAEAIAEAMEESWAVLMQNHGLLVAGRSLRRAADMAEIIERSCEIILGCRAQGVDPPVLPDDVVETLRKMGDLVA
jgi:autoinducer 2 (AI-2) kinase